MKKKVAILASIKNLRTDLSHTHNMNKAIALGISIAKDLPQDAEVQFEVGQTYYLYKKYNLALPYLVKSQSLAPNNYFSILLICNCYSDVGNWQKALPYALKVSKLLKNGNRDQYSYQTLQVNSVIATSYLYSDNWKSAVAGFMAIIDMITKGIINSNQPPIPVPQVNKLTNIEKRLVHRVLYLPIEIKARELEAKLLLSLAAIQAGFRVVIGRTWILSANNFMDLPPGIILFKTLNAIDANNMLVANTEGRHINVVIDEEAFGRSTSARATKLNVDRDAAHIADHIFAQSSEHLKSLNNHLGDISEKAIITGNPKLDLFRYKNTASKNHPAAKRTLILFCCMAGNINPNGRSFSRTIEQTLAAGISSAPPANIEELSQLLKDICQYEVSIIPQFRETIKAVAKQFEHCDIVVRPHPVESNKLWEQAFAKNHNIEVSNTGTLTDWLNKSDAVVYVSGCGSGLEASLQEIPTIRFTGENHIKDPETGLSSFINIEAKNCKDVIKQLNRALTLREKGEQNDEVHNFDKYLFRNKESLNVELIMEQISALQRKYSAATSLPIENIKELSKRRKIKFTLQPFHTNKFPDTSVNQISNLLEIFCHKFNYSVNYNVESIENGLFLISRSNN